MAEGVLSVQGAGSAPRQVQTLRVCTQPLRRIEEATPLEHAGVAHVE